MKKLLLFSICALLVSFGPNSKNCNAFKISSALGTSLGRISDMEYVSNPRYIYASDFDRGVLYQVDVITHTIDDIIDLPYDQPTALSYSPVANTLFITYGSNGIVSLYDLSTKTFTAITYSTENVGCDIEVAPSLRKIFIVSPDEAMSAPMGGGSSPNLVVIDMDSGTTLLNNEMVYGLGISLSSACSLAVSEPNKWLFIGNHSVNPATFARVSVNDDGSIDNIVTTRDFGANGRRIDIDYTGSRILLPAAQWNMVLYDIAASDFDSRLGGWDVPGYIQGAIFSPNGKIVYSTADDGDDFLFVLDTEYYSILKNFEIENIYETSVIETNSTGSFVAVSTYYWLDGSDSCIYLFQGEVHDPTAEAGEDDFVLVNSPVTLNGSDSVDIDEIISYQWTQISGTPVTLVNSDSAVTTFTAPATIQNLTEELIFELTVINSDLVPNTDQISITVVTSLPDADAGEDLSVYSGETVILDGSNSSDSTGIVSYQWEQIEGRTMYISNSDSEKASFVAPSRSESYVFRLTVTNASNISETDDVTVSVTRIVSNDPYIPLELEEGTTNDGCFIKSLKK